MLPDGGEGVVRGQVFQGGPGPVGIYDGHKR